MVVHKEFHGSFGHRVWTQELDGRLSLDAACACRFLHGHNFKIKVGLVRTDGHAINEQGMVTDFKNLAWFKEWIDDVIDHKFMFDINDPALQALFPHIAPKLVQARMKDQGLLYAQVNCDESMSELECELYSGLVLVDFIPTAENICTWMARIVNRKMSRIGCAVKYIEFHETDKCVARYETN